MNYSAPSLERFAHCALSAYGCDAGEAKIVSEHLVAANLAGHDSHGIGMLPMYGAQIRDGNLIPNQKPEFLPRNGAITVVDAKMGFGHRITPIGAGSRNGNHRRAEGRNSCAAQCRAHMQDWNLFGILFEARLCFHTHGQCGRS